MWNAIEELPGPAAQKVMSVRVGSTKPLKALPLERFIDASTSKQRLVYDGPAG